MDKTDLDTKLIAPVRREFQMSFKVKIKCDILLIRKICPVLISSRDLASFPRFHNGVSLQFTFSVLFSCLNIGVALNIAKCHSCSGVQNGSSLFLSSKLRHIAIYKNVLIDNRRGYDISIWLAFIRSKFPASAKPSRSKPIWSGVTFYWGLRSVWSTVSDYASASGVQLVTAWQLRPG